MCRVQLSLEEKDMAKGKTKFIIAMTLIVVVWMGVLPLFSNHSYVQRRLNGYREAGIDPNAFFYSDHPSMRDIERKMDSIVNGPDPSFWQFPAGRP